MIAREEPYVLFLDELNGCTQEVQKSFYSLIYERRIGEYSVSCIKEIPDNCKGILPIVR